MDKKLRYWDISLATNERVNELMMLMTLEEKVAQLSGIIFPWGNFPVKLENDHLVKSDSYTEATKHGIGGISYVNFSLQPKESVEYTNALQKDVRENTRLGIPLFIFEECLYGQIAYGSTVFPYSIGLGATWDPVLVREVFDAMGQEVRCRGGLMTFNPILDIGRDPRWGRIRETFGEDTYLTSRMGVAAVKGLQGGEDVSEGHIAATLKHFAGFAQSMGGRQLSVPEVSHRTFQDEILPTFRAAVKEANPAAVMTTYTEINGIPSTSNKELLNDILREQWGFEGIVVSDFGAIDGLILNHHTASDKLDAAKQALVAGVDMDLPEGNCFKDLLAVAEADKMIMGRIDEAVARVLALKFKMGLFENPFQEERYSLSIVHCENHQSISLKAAEKSLVLLQNKDNVLPINEKALKKLAVIGPHSKYMDVGITIYEGLKETLPEEVELLWAQGCALTDSDENLAYLQETAEGGFTTIHQSAFQTEEEDELMMDHYEGKRPGLIPLDKELKVIEEAVEIAKRADIAILCLGESNQCSGENYAPNRFGDRDDLELIGNQLELLKAVKGAGVPVVVVLINDRPLALGSVSKYADALISAWQPGEMRGRAIARALLGRINPGGKLPVTMPVSVGQLPCYYSQKATGYMRDYAFTKGRYVYPFGYGLSYTTFKIEKLNLSSETLVSNGSLVISLDVINTGTREGDEVVQLYIRDLVSSITQPYKLLKRFERITLKQGEKKEVTFTLLPEDLAFTNINGEFLPEEGEFTLYVGTSSRRRDCLTASFKFKN